MAIPSAFKLEVDLVPQSTWYQNLRAVLPAEIWDKNRRRAYKVAGYRCTICGGQGQMHADEEWEFDHKRLVQTLGAIRAICPDCHKVKHWGRTELVETPVEQLRLIQHFCNVNTCTPNDWKQHLREATEIWKWRSNRTWSMDYGIWTPVVERYRNAPV